MPSLMLRRSDSKTSASTQTCERSAISKMVSAGITRIPWTTFFTVTKPLTSACRSNARRTVPERSSSAMSAALMSQRRSRSLAASSRFAPPLATEGSWLAPSSVRARSASRYSCCVAMSSGL
jgi:hypothetical protein